QTASSESSSWLASPTRLFPGGTTAPALAVALCGAALLVGMRPGTEVLGFAGLVPEDVVEDVNGVTVFDLTQRGDQVRDRLREVAEPIGRGHHVEDRLATAGSFRPAASVPRKGGVAPAPCRSV